MIILLFFDTIDLIKKLIKFILQNLNITKRKSADNKMEVVPPYYVQPSYPVHSTLGILKMEDIESETGAYLGLLKRLEEELKAAKRAELSCGEVMLPSGLLHNIADDVLRMAESEPCGLRGCTLYLNFEGEQECVKIGTIKCDPNTVSTFELFLTLKQASKNSWSLFPFLRSLTRGGTIVINQEFSIIKQKLYRTFSE